MTVYLILSFILPFHTHTNLMKSINNEANFSLIFSSLLPLPPSFVQIFSSAHAVLKQELGELGYRLDDRRFESRQRLGIFLLTTASRPVLGPIQLPIQ
jgi:hypothetical protein